MKYSRFPKKHILLLTAVLVSIIYAGIGIPLRVSVHGAPFSISPTYHSTSLKRPQFSPPSILPLSPIIRSFAQTTSQSPTLSPTENFDIMSTDKDGRRYFPKPPIISDISYSYQQVPNCISNTQSTGCMPIPRSVFPDSPDWAGKIHASPPSCDKSKQYCTQGFPASVNRYSSSEALKPIISVTGLELVDLPGGDRITSSIAVADINGDAMIDIIIGNMNDNNQFLKNDGYGNFAEVIDLPGGNTMDTYSVVVADVNNDDLMDIIIGNKGQKNQLLLNEGNGSYPEAIDLPGGALDTYSIAAADVNGDGMVDIIVGNGGRNTEPNQLLVNEGNGNYSKAVDLPDLPNGKPSRTWCIAAADFDGDGMVDIITGNYNQKNQLLLNDGDGGYSQVIDLPGAGSLTFSIAAADINGDGMVDIIVGNSNFRHDHLLVNQGEGSFSDPVDLPGDINLSTGAIAATDINGDGKLDIICGSKSSAPNKLLLNNGDGSYSEAIDLPGGFFITDSIVAADVTGNGMVDLIIGNGSMQSNQLLINVGDGSYSKAVDLPGDIMDTESIVVADVNGDEIVDIIIGNYREENQLLVGKASGSYAEPILLPGGAMHTYSIAAADVNGDGMVDLMIGNGGVNTDPQTEIKPNQILINQGNGSYFEAFDLPGGAMYTRCIAAADIDGDGMVDIIVGNDRQENQLLINRSNGNFSEAIDLPSGAYGNTSRTWSIAAADINGDGMVDILIGNDAQDNQLLLNDGYGNFSEVINLPGSSKSRTRSITAADVNGDSMMDIIIGNYYYSENNQLLINQGGGIFTEALDLPGGVLLTTSIITADINNDGMVDIIIGNNGPNQILFNEGGQNFFTEAVKLPGGVVNTWSVAAADVNNDGMVDIVVGNNVGQKNQVILYDSCPKNGVHLHSRSWCFKCPPFMGRDRLHGMGNVICRECMPDYVQQDSDLSQCETKLTCPLGERKIGEDSCSTCSNGTYYNNQIFRLINDPSTWDDERCVSCPIGTYSSEDLTAIDGCFLCRPGTYQQMPGSSSCHDCPVGSYQPDFGKDKCIECPKGEYCDSKTSLKCPPGTYNDKLGQSNIEACIECRPGTFSITNGADSENACLPCPAGAYSNQTGQTSCSPCGVGTFQSQKGQTSCEECPTGTYSDQSGFEQCVKCRPGTFQQSTGRIGCNNCTAGSYQPDFGKDECKLCSMGGYCDSIQEFNGGFTACPPGTYNDKLGQDNKGQCIACPPGTYSTTNGAESENTCLPCPPGTFNNQSGQTSCKACTGGTFQDKEGQEICSACPVGSFTDISGSKKCSNCPHRLASINGSSTCPFCAEGFYLNDTSTAIDSSDIIQAPFKHCLDCPPHGASCRDNTTLSELDVYPGYWRHSNTTSILYPCNNKSDICIGFKYNSAMKSDDFGDIYCKSGHKGPLCEVCTDKDFYFSDNDGQCIQCPTSNSFSILFIFIILGAVGVVGLILYFAAQYGLSLSSTALQAKAKKLVSFYQILVSNLSLQAKLKLLVSFYQIVASLEDVYGVRFHSSWTGWMNLYSFLSLDFLYIFPIPVRCIATTTWKQIVVGATWPFMILFVGAIILLACRVYWNVKNHQDNDDNLVGSHASKLKNLSIQGTIILLYFTIPTVSRSIFDAIKCRAFADNNQGGSASYLIVDMAIPCNRFVDSRYASIFAIFWVLFIIWIILIPLGFFGLLTYIYEDVKLQRINALTNSCRFLWNDYDPSMIYWDVVDTLRKIFLTGLIMLIDPQEGSKKILRLVIATVISLLYFGALLAFRPYKRQGNYNLAFLSNFLLISCFSLGIILKLCDEDENVRGVDNYGSQSFCSRFIGDSYNSYAASFLVITLLLSMLLVTIGLVVINTVMEIRAPTVYMRSTGHAPILELPEGCTFHAFMSHKWATGQAQTHAIVRKMQLLMPGLKVWLDVDQLEDMNQLEESVDQSAVFVIFYSKGYFKSENCRRELYAAINLSKPIVVVYKGDPSVLDEMAQECISNCHGVNVAGPDLLLQRLFNNDEFNLQMISSMTSHNSRYGPIQWLDEASFSAAVLNLIYYRILINLPHYKDNFNGELLKDIVVPGALESVKLQAPINLLVCASNQGSLDVAKDFKLFVSNGNSTIISIYDNAASFLEINTTRGSVNDGRKMISIESNATSLSDVIESRNSSRDDENMISICSNTVSYLYPNSRVRDSFDDDENMISIRSNSISFLGTYQTRNSLNDDDDENMISLRSKEGRDSFESLNGDDENMISIHSKGGSDSFEDVWNNEENDSGKNDLIPQPKTFDRPTFLLLYLNEDTFASSEQEGLTATIEYCIDNPNINVILVHEQDVSKGGCKFHLFFRDAPQKLINRPYNLLQNIAIPLHSIEEYRRVSLNILLKKVNEMMKK